MAGNSGRRAASSSSHGGVADLADQDWGIIGLSVAGIFFILLGLVSLALPDGQEGVMLWQLDPDHALRLMDSVGVFAMVLGVSLTWLGGMFWRRQMAVGKRRGFGSCVYGSLSPSDQWTETTLPDLNLTSGEAVL